MFWSARGNKLYWIFNRTEVPCICTFHWLLNNSNNNNNKRHCVDEKTLRNMGRRRSNNNTTSNRKISKERETTHTYGKWEREYDSHMYALPLSIRHNRAAYTHAYSPNAHTQREHTAIWFVLLQREVAANDSQRTSQMTRTYSKNTCK